MGNGERVSKLARPEARIADDHIVFRYLIEWDVDEDVRKVGGVCVRDYGPVVVLRY